MRRLVTVLSLAALLGPASAANAITYLQFKSSAGDFVGQGQEWSITPAEQTIAITSYTVSGTVNLMTTSGTFWSLSFQAPNAQLPTVGSYENATRWLGNASAGPRLDVSGDGRGCNQLSGRFDVLVAEYAPDGTPLHFAADFVQYCENRNPPLVGSVRYDVEMPYPAFTCGNGVVEGPEQCEPGTSDVTDCCATACAFESSAYVCRSAVGGCDAAETCTGTSITCPNVDLLRPAGFVCRSALQTCDVAETCNGTSTACPADQYRSAGAVCRAASGVCDAVETCTGTSAPCPLNFRLPSTTVCRASAGSCDSVEFCPGNSASCPADTVRPAGTACRAAEGICDVAESCDGTNSQCPTDAGIATTPMCRAASGVCDAAEHCDGTTSACPADTGGGVTGVCRPAAGVCDVAESCDGTSSACPADGFASSSLACRLSTGTCDPAERCPGSEAACPSDVHAADFTPCDDGLFCNAADFCSSGTCSVHAGNPCSAACALTCHENSDSCLDAAGTPCASDGDPCTDDVCDGTGGCGVPNAAPCDDGDPCTTDDHCSNGVCVGGGLPSACDDANPCTVDACDAGGCVHSDRPPSSVSAECSVSAQSKFKLIDDGDRSSLSWQLGPQSIDIDYAGLGSPDDDTAYALCIYDSSLFVPTLVASFVIEPSATLWRGRDPKGWTYRDREGTSAGITRALLKPGPRGRLKVSGGGANLALPGATGAQYFESDTYVEVDLVSSAGPCWSAIYSAPVIRRNDASRFEAAFTFGD